MASPHAGAANSKHGDRGRHLVAPSTGPARAYQGSAYSGLLKAQSQETPIGSTRPPLSAW